MTKRDRNSQLAKLIHSNWPKRSIELKNKVGDVRVLLAGLGYEYGGVDDIAVEIETLAGTALGLGDEVLCREEIAALEKLVSQLRTEYKKACKQAVTHRLRAYGLAETSADIVGCADGAAASCAALAVPGVMAGGRPSPRQSELDVGASLGPDARAQVSFREGAEVPYGTKGSTRPDYIHGCETCIEVKNYDLSRGPSGLIRNVVQQARARAAELPVGMAQHVIVDIRGQDISKTLRAQIESRIIFGSDRLVQSVEFIR